MVQQPVHHAYVPAFDRPLACRMWKKKKEKKNPVWNECQLQILYPHTNVVIIHPQSGPTEESPPFSRVNSFSRGRFRLAVISYGGVACERLPTSHSNTRSGVGTDLQCRWETCTESGWGGPNSTHPLTTEMSGPLPPNEGFSFSSTHLSPL